jgi:endo-1,4-beta-xylanase
MEWTRRGVLAAAAAAPLSARAAPGLPEQIKAAAVRKGLIVGCAVEPDSLLGDAPFAGLVQAQCSQLTPENAMKWYAVAPGPDTFDFTKADRIAAWAQARGMGLFGHCLVWHDALPRWAPKSPTAPQAERLMQGRIQSMVGRYKGRARAWDVVIEAVEIQDGRADGLRRSPWLQALGPRYLADAYAQAHAIDPRARLSYGDYGLEHDDVPWMADKRVKVLGLLERLKAAGAPVHILNIQAHLLGDRPPVFGKALRRFLAEVAALGLEIYIGELDVTDDHQGGHWDERDAATAELYRRFLDVALDEPAVKSVTTWGLSDRYNSKVFVAPRPAHDERPLPFDKDLRPKLAETALLEAIRNAPARRPSAALA